jgi:hypothetical protein
MIGSSKRCARRLSVSAEWIPVIFVVVGLFAPFAAFCDEAVPAAGPKAVWPSGIEGWKIAEGPMGYDATTAFRYMDGAAELFLAYNMRKLTVLRYEKSGHPAITLEHFQMDSPEDAYGIFSFESDDPGAGIGQGSEFGGGLLRFWKGYHFVSVYGDGPGPDVEAATLRLGEKVASSITDTGSLPRILSYLPEGEAPFTRKQTWFLHSHILLNQRFFVAHENVLSLANDVDVALARYGTGKERVHFLLIKYPAQGRADLALSVFRSAYMRDGSGRLSAKTAHNKWTITEKFGSFILVVFDAPDKAFARRLIGAARIAVQKEGK